MSSKDENKNKNENENENGQNMNVIKWRWRYDNEDNETMSQNEKNIRIKNINDYLDEIIDKSKSFEEQIKSLKKLEGLKGYWPYNDFGDKELKSKYFKIELADMSNEIDKKLFKQIFAHTLETLANKLINTTSKEENQIIVNNIKENKEKLYKECETSYGYDYVIQSSDRRVDLIDAINLILKFNEKT